MNKDSTQVYDDQTLSHVTHIFKALADLNRIRIMELLVKGEASVGDISQSLNLSQSNVSHQLKLLKTAHLVKSQRQGQSIIYSVDDLHVATMLTQALNHANHRQESGL